VSAEQAACLPHVTCCLDREAEAAGNLSAGGTNGRVGIDDEDVQFRRRRCNIKKRIHGPCVKKCFEHCIRLVLSLLNPDSEMWA
jgi:hypothetical protein